MRVEIMNDEYEEETEGSFFFFGEGAMHAAVGETEERCFVCNEREKKQVVLHVGGCC